jgi:hypothetical protein
LRRLWVSNETFFAREEGSGNWFLRVSKPVMWVVWGRKREMARAQILLGVEEGLVNWFWEIGKAKMEMEMDEIEKGGKGEEVPCSS